MLTSTVITKDELRCNTMVKRYPDGSAMVLCSNRAIFRKPGYEAVREPERRFSPPPDGEHAYEVEERLGIAYDGAETPREAAAKAAALERAQRRARAAVRDLALSNPMRWFVTLTFDKERVDRWNDKEVLRVTKNWLDNSVRRKGLAYVLVPERHKDGAIHFHGFFNDAPMGAVDSGHLDKRGHRIFNLEAWPWGFTTAIEVYGDYHRAVGYVCKYVTKEREKVGGRWYYHGGALRKPDVEYLATDFEAVTAGMEAVEVPSLPGAEIVTIFTDRTGGGCAK